MGMTQSPGTAAYALRESNTSPSIPTDFTVGTSFNAQNTTQTVFGRDISFFDDVFPYPDEHITRGEGVSAQQPGAEQSQNGAHISFRAGTSNEFDGSFGDLFGRPDMFGADGHSELRNSPMMPSPEVLPHHVDASKYQNVEDGDWARFSIDYDANSPASPDGGSNGPLTPISSNGADFVGRSFSVDAFQADAFPAFEEKTAGINPAELRLNRTVFDVARPSFSTTCQCPTCRGGFYPQVSLGHIFNAAQPPPVSMGLGNSNLFPGSAPAVGAFANPAAALPGNHSTLNDMLVGDRSTMETTPEGSVTGSEGGSDSDDNDDMSDADVNDQAVAQAAHRRDRDKLLLKMRDRGLSYKEIKRKFGFSEAESTLRGRVRVLTKDKSERVRKPEWTERDLHLLNHAVERYAEPDILGEPTSNDSHGRVPWKKISTWMKKNGSSYEFAPATCAKKWRQIN